jgi:hypothetical protein
MEPGRKLPKEADVRTSFTQELALTVDWCDVARVTIDLLPDIALLEMFYFYMYGEQIEAWHTLVHVCQNGEALFLARHVAWICDFTAKPEHQ